jgi:S-adenosylmethionine:tRNA ribosyltransferase-isomerase
VRTELFDYALPAELIAARPPPERDGGRLLVLDPTGGPVAHAAVRDLPSRLPPRCLLVANDTRVIPARLRARRPTGGAVEVLLVREVEAGEAGCRWLALLRANKPLRRGAPLDLGGGVEARVGGRGARGEAVLDIALGSDAVRRHVAARGEVPLPPYIRRAPEEADRARYQTVFARADGSVAAPTAGLHFTEELMARLRAQGHEIVFLTLHVGPGTFRPITCGELSAHAMDAERYAIPAATAAAIGAAKGAGRPVVAVGTTTARALEGAVRAHGALAACAGDTDLFIAPPFDFRVVDGLFTNFHLPRSTLLCLVAALAGRERVLAAYAEAVARRYRFYSYGDAMLILPGAP